MGPIEQREEFLLWLIGRKVQIDESGKMGRITSVSVTSDGFLLGRTSPGYDRGVFLGRAPWLRGDVYSDARKKQEPT
jgi:hypothetical protein